MEQDKPKNLLILGYTLAICAVLVGTVVFVDQYLRADVRQEYQRKVLEAENVQFRSLRADEDGKLGKYIWIDQGKGVVRLPKARARELVLKEWAARPEGVVKPEPGPAAAPVAPGPPPAPQVGAPPITAPPSAEAPPQTPGIPTDPKEPPSTTQPPALRPGETQKKGDKQ